MEHAKGYYSVTLSCVTLPTCVCTCRFFGGHTLIPGCHVDYQVCGPVVPYHTSSDDNQCDQQMPQVQSVAELSVPGKQ